MNELFLGRKGVYQLPQIRLISSWLGSLFSCCLGCESWNIVEKNEDSEILLANTMKCCRRRMYTMCGVHQRKISVIEEIKKSYLEDFGYIQGLGTIWKKDHVRERPW